MKRFVEGANAGGSIVVTFTPEHQATRVEAEAHPPAKGFDNGLGKLSDLGVQKSLEKLLADHQRALEGYQPGRVRGDVDKVLRSLRDLTEPVLARDKAASRAVVSTFLKTAAIAAISDGEADDVERQTMQVVARSLCHVELDDATLATLIESATQAARADGIEARCDRIGASLRALGVGELGLAVATLIAQVSHGVDTRELAALQRIGHAAGVGEGALLALIARIDAQLTTAPAR